tara:strand:+ start:722 stop:985 length:264 start_codon:yes stop_codon:yes gene_type:complete
MLELYENFTNVDYFNLPPDEQEFCQRFLFLEYIEAWEYSRAREGLQGALKEFIMADMYLHIHDENYETAQLYQDMIDRYKIELPNFE